MTSSRADISAQKRIDEHRAANPKTFDEFCAENRVKPNERVELGYRLAQIRYENTLLACFPILACLRKGEGGT